MDNAKSERNLQWWVEPKATRHKSVFANLERMKADESGRQTLLLAWLALYTDRAEEFGGSYEAHGLHRKRRARQNVAANCVQTVHAQVTATRPAPWVVTSGADWSLTRKAEKQTKYLEGEFERIGVFEKTSNAAQDALIFGDGWLKVLERDGRPDIEVTWPGEIMADRRERRHGRVRTLYQRKLVDKELLGQLYPKARMILDAQGPEAPEDGTGSDTDSLIDQAIVIESWHLGTSDKPGRHIICTSNETLVDDEWAWDVFPFAKMPFTRHPRDWYSQGLMEEVSGLQSEVNHMTEKISEAYNLFSPHWLLPRQANLSDSKLNNLVGNAYEYDAVPGVPPPQVATPPAISPDFIRYKDAQIESCYMSRGISQHAAQSQKPAGLNSGRAQLVNRDMFTQRYIEFNRSWERLHMDVAGLIVKMTKRIAQDPEKKSKLVACVGKGMLEQVSWSAVDLKEEQYQVKTFPVSALANSPEGRLSQVQQMYDMGLITDPEEMRELLEFPDLERYNKIRSAGRELAESMVERALDGKEAVAIPEMPLDFARRHATLQLNLAIIKGAPDTALDRLRTFIAHVDKLAQSAAGAAAEAAAGAAPPQPGMPTEPTATPAVMAENRTAAL